MISLDQVYTIVCISW